MFIIVARPTGIAPEHICQSSELLMERSTYQEKQPVRDAAALKTTTL
jgi:hypothetical protein